MYASAGRLACMLIAASWPAVRAAPSQVAGSLQQLQLLCGGGLGVVDRGGVLLEAGGVGPERVGPQPGGTRSAGSFSAAAAQAVPSSDAPRTSQ